MNLINKSFSQSLLSYTGKLERPKTKKNETSDSNNDLDNKENSQEQEMEEEDTQTIANYPISEISEIAELQEIIKQQRQINKYVLKKIKDDDTKIRKEKKTAVENAKNEKQVYIDKSIAAKINNVVTKYSNENSEIKGKIVEKTSKQITKNERKFEVKSKEKSKIIKLIKTSIKVLGESASAVTKNLLSNLKSLLITVEQSL